jgi:hypothetical protein
VRVRLHGLGVLLHARSFAIGLAFGGVAFFVTAVISTVSRRRIPDLAGVAFVAAAWLAVRGSWGIALARGSAAYALALLACGGALVALITSRNHFAPRHVLAMTALALAPGAIMLAVVTPLAGSTTSRVVLAVAAIAVGVGLRDFDAINGPRGAPWLLFAISAAGVYLAVPDTELARVLLGVSLPFILLSVPKPRCALGPAGSAAMGGLFVWVVVVGGRGRPGSVVGGLATIGLLVAEPIGRRLVGRDRKPWAVQTARHRDLNDRNRYAQNQDPWLAAAAVAAIIQFGFAVYAARVVGRYDAALSALLVLLPMVAVAVFAAPQLFPLKRDRRQHEHRHRTSRRGPRRHSTMRAHG